ncbi:MAG: hypothetical protein ACKVZJ_08560 [Phycisphaerales bacterium]
MRTFVKSSVVLVALAGTSISALARQGGGAGGEAKPVEPIKTLVAFEHGDCLSMLTSPKDAALVSALKLIPVRVTEIMNTPGLGPDKDEVPEGIVELVTTALTGPMRFAVIQQGFDDRSRMPKIGVVMSYAAKDQAAAKAMMERVENIRKMAEREGAGGGNDEMKVRPSERFAGMNAIVLPPGTLLYGPRQSTDGWRFEVLFGHMPDPDGSFWGALPQAPAGSPTAGRMVIDFPAITPVAEMFGGMVSGMMPNGDQVLQGFRDMGLLGPDAMSVESVWQTGADGIGSTMTIRRAGKYAEKLGLVRKTVSEADLSVIPSDAVFASISKIDPQGTWARLKSQVTAMPQGAEHFGEVLDQINEHLGINVEQDVIAALGETAALSISDTTGGNSLFSGVGFFEVKDGAKLSAAIQKAADAANREIAREMQEDGPKPGVVRIESWAAPASAAGLQGVKFTSLRSPGLPLPVEPTIAMVGKWMVVGLSPQSAMSAAAHVAGGGKGLAGHAGFASSLGGTAVGNATSVTFVDNAAAMRDGYPLLQMLGSALTNFARSPDSSSPREVMQVVPSLSDLRAGAKPGVFLTKWNGDDMVMTSKGDPSLLVNVAGLLGTGDLGSIIFGGIIGAGAGHEAGIEEGRERAHWEHHEEHNEHHMEGEEPEIDEPAEPPAPEEPAEPAAPAEPALR